MPTLQSPTAGAEVRASLFAIARPALGLHADAEGAGGDRRNPSPPSRSNGRNGSRTCRGTRGVGP